MKKGFVRPGTETPAQRAALREMLKRCDKPIESSAISALPNAE